MSHKDNIDKYRHLDNVDIFLVNNVLDTFGNQLLERNLNPLMGYLIVHSITGRLLPQCSRTAIMGASYAHSKFAEVMFYYLDNEIEHDFDNYIFLPMYLTEIECMKGFTLLYDETDIKEQNDLNL